MSMSYSNVEVSIQRLLSTSKLLDSLEKKMFETVFIIALAFLGNFLQVVLSQSSNEIIGCGGFIKSNTEINYKIIQVM